jgi:RNAse (barnase) inhibitor barstar
MPTVQLDGRKILDWQGFHAECKAVFGFPDFYGQNMDAWIDCLSGLRDDDGMSRFVLRPDEILHIEVTHSDALQRQAPQILAALEECIDEVNQRHVDFGQKPALNLILH